MLAAIYDIVKLATSSREDQSEWIVTPLGDDLERNVSCVVWYEGHTVADDKQHVGVGALRLG